MTLVTKNDTLKDIALKLNNREYRDEITKDEESVLKEKNIFIIFGASDDLLEARGLIDDEISVYGNGEIYIDLQKSRILLNKEDYVYDLDPSDEVLKDIVNYYYDNNTVKIEYSFDNMWEYNLIINNPKFKDKIKYEKVKILDGNIVYGEMLIVEVLNN